MANEAEEGGGGMRRRVRGVDGGMERLGEDASSEM